ncbi:MAG: NAD(P)H-dependent oxidoreductase subunit E [Candidatus Wallbacteria bacterium]|nr:NAD(P)H-dependent oxidoreductase subunit E [Candidatus Wallbacteria bacterium]
MKSEILSRHAPDRSNLLEILHDIQRESGKNFVSDRDMKEISAYIGMPVSQIESTVNFYTMFSRRPRGKFVIRICCSPSCSTGGPDDLLQLVCSELGVRKGGTTKDKLFTVEASSCLGLCDQAPAMMINDQVYGHLTREKIRSLIEDCRRKE